MNPKANTAEQIVVESLVAEVVEDDAAFAIEELGFPEIREQANAMSCD